MGDQKTTNDFWLFYMIQIRSEGACIRSEKTGTGSGKIYCDNKPMGLCNSSELIYTSEEKTYRLNILSNIQKKTSDCDELILSSGLLSEKTTTNEEETINSNNKFFPVTDCKSAGFSGAESLANSSQLDFLSSTHGRLAVSARTAFKSPLTTSAQKSRAESCWTFLYKNEVTGQANDAWKKTIEEYVDSILTKTISCSYTTGSGNCHSGVDAYKFN